MLHLFGHLIQHYLIQESKIQLCWMMLQLLAQGPVVQTMVSANLGLNFNPGFFFLLSKALSLFFLECPIIKL